MSALDAYLARLGVGVRPAPTLDTLHDLHRRHLDAIPYDNLAIMLGRPDSVDPVETLERIGAGGNAGYCFHHNGAFGLALAGLGFDVERRPGSTLEELGPSGSLDHLVLVVGGLPTAKNPAGRWWPDLGYGDAFREPLPLVEGIHRQDGFTYRLARVSERGWTFHHDPRGSFHGTAVGGPGVGQGEVDAAHRRLSTPPGGHFTRKLVVQRRRRDSAETLRGCVFTRVGADPCRVELTSYAAWRAGLVELGVSLAAVPEDALEALFARSLAAHQDWSATG